MHHDWRLLAVAVAVCALSAFAAVLMFSTAPRDPPVRRAVWLGLGGLAAGSGTWTTHFVAMLAYEAHAPAGYAIGPTLGSLILAILGMSLGLALGASPRRARAAAGGVVIGLSVGAMHYLGMSGYHTAGRVSLDAGGVALSVVIGGGLAALALMLARPGASRARQLAAAALLVLAVAGLHFTGMASLSVTPDSTVLRPHDLFSRPVMMNMAMVAGGFIFALALAGVALDKMSHDTAHLRLLKAMDAMAEGVALFDPAGRLMAWNPHFAGIYDGTGVDLVKGKAFATLLEESVAAGAFSAAGSESWAAERDAVFRGDVPNTVLQTRRGRWVRISDRRTPGGGTVSTCVDITELKDVEGALTAARDGAQRLAALAERAEALAGLGHLRMELTSGEMQCSPGYLQILGLDPDTKLDRDIVGATTHPDDRDMTRRNLHRRLSGEMTDGHSVVRIVRPGGEIRHVHCNMALERDADGRPLAFLTTAVDVTALKAAEAALTAARDKAERLSEIASMAEDVARIGHWRKDMATGEVEWSAGYLKIYGLAPDSHVETQTIQSRTHPDDVGLAEVNLRRVLSGEASYVDAIVRVHPAEGETRYVHGTMAAERDGDGRLTAILGTLVDVTEVKLAELAVAESEARFRNLANNAPDIINESDAEGRATFISRACETVTGYTSEELMGPGLISIIHPDDLEGVAEMCRVVTEAKGAIPSWPVEFRATHKSGEELWLESKPSLLTDPVTGAHKGFIDIIRDITPRKRMAAELETARAAAEAAAAVKAEFLANMSHELRTPLTSILGFTEMAAQQQELAPQTRRYVDRVAEASKALLCTVNDILDFSKLEAGQVVIRPEPVRVADLAHGTLELFSPQAAAKHLELNLEVESPEAVVELDPDRVRQILLNLVGNAVKFTAAGTVTLSTRYDGHALTVEVADTGGGIPDHKLEQLFKRFSQVDGSLTRAQGGTGLGLAICKGLVEAMGGEIGVESREGEGSRFWFRIPAAAAAADAGVGAPAAEAAGLAGLKVLVVDDHPANRELARLFLAAAGAEVAEAEDGEAAVARAAEERFDVILMDLRMPRLDGLGALGRLRGNRGPNQATPVVAFTADLTSELAANLCSQGFDGGVAKPLDAAALLQAVAAAAQAAPGASGSAAA